MCGRFAQQRPASELAEIFSAEPLAEELGPRFNVAPTDEAFVVVQRDERRAITAYRWGLIPHWADSAKVASRGFNARSETVASSPTFRDSLARKRCLVPVDVFYEWRREGTSRQPYTIGRADGRLLVFAGLWDGWRDPTTDTVRRTFTIITTTPNETMAPIHDRMPVVLADSDWATWLDPGRSDRGELLALLAARREPELLVQPVSRLVNDVRNDGPELVAPIAIG